MEAEAKRLGIPFHAISAASGEGVKGLLEAAWPLVQEAAQRETESGHRETEAPGEERPFS